MENSIKIMLGIIIIMLTAILVLANTLVYP